mgnify:CR=1 FL=1
MKQIFQSLANGNTSINNVPVPAIQKGYLLIQTKHSLVSAGTERMLVNFSKANPLDKAKQQPEKFKEVIDKVINEGPLTTVDSIRFKLDQPIPMGYCNVGEVVGIGEGESDFQIGDRVVSNGPHAEFVSIPFNLCAKIPDSVDSKSALFSVLGSIGLQGVRIAEPTIGETFVVSGLGLVGLLAAKILKANGCKVLGMDPDNKKCEFANSQQIKSLCLSDGVDPLKWCFSQNNNKEVDGVIIAAATKSSEPIKTAAVISRKRGRIILIGDTGINIDRKEFYEKEITFKVSCSYGPGRYDEKYEKYGHDYPLAYVRWTEKRNFETILTLLDEKKITTNDLSSHSFSLDQATLAYELLRTNSFILGITINYNNHEVKKLANKIKYYETFSDLDRIDSEPVVSFIGAGNYASRVLIPAFYKNNLNLHTLLSRSGGNSDYLCRKYKFKYASTDYSDIFKNEKTNTVVIVSRHDSHAKLLIEGIKNNKNIYIEKPICLNIKELNQIEIAIKNQYEFHKSKNIKPPIIMVGFNRRFSPLKVKMKKELDLLPAEKAFIYTCNAGSLPSDNWNHSPRIGGGRLLGEACHFVDLIRFLVDSPILKLSCSFAIDSQSTKDVFTIQMSFENGSIGTIHYFSNGSKNFPKERLEVFSAGSILSIDNFKKLSAWGIPKFKNKTFFNIDKGQRNCVRSFVESIKNSTESPIPINQILEVQRSILNAI